MTAMTTNTPPSERVDIALPEDSDSQDELYTLATAQIIAKANELRAQGKPAIFQVWYPQTTEADYDVVEVAEDGTVTTMPSYEGAN